jgi:hypothetical protein
MIARLGQVERALFEVHDDNNQLLRYIYGKSHLCATRLWNFTNG